MGACEEGANASPAVYPPPATLRAEDAGFPEACFKIPYDYLVLGVG